MNTEARRDYFLQRCNTHIFYIKNGWRVFVFFAVYEQATLHRQSTFPPFSLIKMHIVVLGQKRSDIALRGAFFFASCQNGGNRAYEWRASLSVAGCRGTAHTVRIHGIVDTPRTLSWLRSSSPWTEPHTATTIASKRTRMMNDKKEKC